MTTNAKLKGGHAKCKWVEGGATIQWSSPRYSFPRCGSHLSEEVRLPNGPHSLASRHFGFVFFPIFTVQLTIYSKVLTPLSMVVNGGKVQKGRERPRARGTAEVRGSSAAPFPSLLPLPPAAQSRYIMSLFIYQVFCQNLVNEYTYARLTLKYLFAAHGAFCCESGK